ncbi:MAG: hypothetical protein MZU97_08010 [Bacillus subtilis]|nr:hypothetical protein [Bacillus subtilis]
MPSCGAVLVRRDGYRVSIETLSFEGGDASSCGRCGAAVPIVLSRPRGRAGG